MPCGEGRAAQGVAGVGVLQLDQRAQFAGAEMVGTLALLAVRDEDLADAPFGLIAGSVNESNFLIPCPICRLRRVKRMHPYT